MAEEPTDVALGYILRRSDEAERDGVQRIGDVERRDSAVLFGGRDDQDVADGEERARVDAAEIAVRNGLHERNVVGIVGVEDMQAGVRSADVDGVTLPIHAPDGLGEVAVVDASRA